MVLGGEVIGVVVGSYGGEAWRSGGCDGSGEVVDGVVGW